MGRDKVAERQGGRQGGRKKRVERVRVEIEGRREGGRSREA